MTTGEITEKQKSIIESFSCERLSCNVENKMLIRNFFSEKGGNLIDYLHNCAWEEDVECQTAFYVIKSPDNEVALFFSLKCGSLFDPLDEKVIEQRAENTRKLLEIIQEAKKDKEERDITGIVLEFLRSGKNISMEEIRKGIKAKQTLMELTHDKEREGNQQIIRVGHTYPGIELVHFCTNDLMKEKWKSYCLDHPLGEVMFWHFIAPIIYDTQKRIGCQYAFLFAADLSEDGVLVNYYNQALKFEQPKEVGTNKPRYDWCCEFMCQEIKTLKKNRKEYFDNFNPDVDDVIA